MSEAYSKPKEGFWRPPIELKPLAVNDSDVRTFDSTPTPAYGATLLVCGLGIILAIVIVPVLRNALGIGIGIGIGSVALGLFLLLIRYGITIDRRSRTFTKWRSLLRPLKPKIFDIRGYDSISITYIKMNKGSYYRICLNSPMGSTIELVDVGNEDQAWQFVNETSSFLGVKVVDNSATPERKPLSVSAVLLKIVEALLFFAFIFVIGKIDPIIAIIIIFVAVICSRWLARRREGCKP